MKKITILALTTMLFNIFLSSCADKSTSDKNGASKNPVKYFPTLEACQESAKNDLMEALKTMKGNSFGTNLEAVAQSKAVKLVTLLFSISDEFVLFECFIIAFANKMFPEFAST